MHFHSPDHIRILPAVLGDGEEGSQTSRHRHRQHDNVPEHLGPPFGSGCAGGWLVGTSIAPSTPGVSSHSTEKAEERGQEERRDEMSDEQTEDQKEDGATTISRKQGSAMCTHDCKDSHTCGGRVQTLNVTQTNRRTMII